MVDYEQELRDMMSQWDSEYLRWFKVTEPGQYHFAVYDEPEIIEINENRVLRLPAVSTDDREVYFIGFGQNPDPLSPYVGLLAVGYYGDLNPGWEFDLVAEQGKEYVSKDIPQTRPYVNRLLDEARHLTHDELAALLEGP